MPASLVRVARSVVVATAVTLLLVAPVAAKEPVDPNTLNPPPPASFNATCERVGSGILCNLAFSDPPFADEPSGIVCDGTELLVSQTRSVIGKRFYDRDGNLERRHYREAYAGTLTNPTTGRTAPWIAHDTVDHVLAVAGRRHDRPADHQRAGDPRIRARRPHRARRRGPIGDRRRHGHAHPRWWSPPLRRLLRAR